MKRIIFVLASIAMAFIAGLVPRGATAAGPTKVQGIIGQNTTWTLADSPYIVTNKTLVPDGVTLKIEPGVEVKFDGFFTLQIEGILIAQGTKNQMIKFTSNQANPKAGDWDSIYFVSDFAKNGAIVDQNDSYVSGSILSYAEVSFGAGIQAEYNAYLSNNFIHDMRGAVVSFAAGKTFIGGPGAGAIAIMGCIRLNCGCPNNQCTYIVKDNIISHNAASGISSVGRLGGTVKIVGNIIQRNNWPQGGGISCFFGLRCILQDNIIIQNGASAGGGVYLEDSPIVRHNVIANNCVTNGLIPGADWHSAWNGAAMAARRNLELENNSIVGNFSANGPSSAMLHFYDAKTDKWNHNNISNLTVYEIYEQTATRLKGFPNATLDATNNYWGATDPKIISTRIWDVNDDFDLPTVNFLPILNQPDPGAPTLNPNMLEPMYCGCGVANTDTDGDTFADCNDQCPKDKNKQMPGVCGCGVADDDADKDGVMDCNDKCPNTTKGVKVDATGCPPDSDGDGFPDYIDQCPNDKNKLIPGQCGCGVADIDTDKDGVLDCRDKCANTPANTKVDGAGCPLNPAPVCTFDVKTSQKVQGGYDLFWTAKFANLIVINGTNVNGSYVVFAADSRNQPFNADPNQRPQSGEKNDINHNDIHYVNPTNYSLTATGPGGTCQQSADVPPSQQAKPMWVSPKTLTPPPLWDWWKKPALPQPPSSKPVKSWETNTEIIQPLPMAPSGVQKSQPRQDTTPSMEQVKTVKPPAGAAAKGAPAKRTLWDSIARFSCGERFAFVARRFIIPLSPP